VHKQQNPCRQACPALSSRRCYYNYPIYVSRYWTGTDKLKISHRCFPKTNGFLYRHYYAISTWLVWVVKETHFLVGYLGFRVHSAHHLSISGTNIYSRAHLASSITSPSTIVKGIDIDIYGKKYIITSAAASLFRVDLCAGLLTSARGLLIAQSTTNSEHCGTFYQATHESACGYHAPKTLVSHAGSTPSKHSPRRYWREIPITSYKSTNLCKASNDG